MSAAEQKPERSFAARALIGAWLSLLILVAAAAGYVLVSPPPPAQHADGRDLAMAVPEDEAGTERAARLAESAETAPATQPDSAASTAATAEMPPAEPTTAESDARPEAPAKSEPAEVAETEVDAPAEAAEDLVPTPPATSEPVEVAETEVDAPAEAAEDLVPTPPSKANEAAAPEPEIAAEPGEAPQQATLPETAPSEATESVPPAPADASAPWRRNSVAFAADDTRPRIAVVLTGLGLSSSATEAAIEQLPAGITLSFTPYARRLDEWIALARADGHEVMLDLPMEPTSYPNDDPGPQALLTALSARQNLERLDWALSRGSGFVGVAAVMGSRFAASGEDLEPILEELKARGFLYLDNRASDDSVAPALATKIGLPVAVNDRALDWAQASRVAIDARLVQLENIAAAEGFAVAIGQPYPVTIERLRVWSADLDARGFALAPITAVANRQKQHLLTAERAPGE